MTNATQPIPELDAFGIREMLMGSIPNRDNVVIEGEPGIGKTQLTKQVTKELGYDLIQMFPVYYSPTDIKGILPISGEDTNFKPIGQMALAYAATRKTVLFVDDIGQANESTQAALMPVLLERGDGNRKLPDCVSIVAATNGRGHRSGARPLLEAVKSRFLSIVRMVPSVEAWLQWAEIEPGFSPNVMGYVRYRPEMFCKFEPSQDLVQSPSARTWEHVSKIESRGYSPAVERAMIMGAVGAGAATEYLTYRTLHSSLVDVQSILKTPNKATIPTNPSELYAVSAVLSGMANRQNFASITRYCERLIDAQQSEFAVLTVRRATDRDKNLVQTSAYTSLMAGDCGQLFSGHAN